MRKYIIIGGAGFIGFHLSKELLARGNKVAVIDVALAEPATIHNLPFTRYAVNIENAKKVAAVFKKEKPDVVFHLAGPINLRRAIGGPFFLKDINFLSRINGILDVCKKHNVKKLIFVSSGGAIYEGAATIPTGEEYPASPSSLYGLANLLMEQYIQAYSKIYSLDFTIARLSNAYGPRQWQSGVIPSFIMKTVKKERPVIFGKGNQTRDFVFIDDVVEALVMLAQHGKNEVYNVGNGQEISLRKLFTLVNRLLGANVKPKHERPRFFEVQRSALSVSKIKKELGWQPRTDIKTGLLKTIEWFKREK